MAVSAEEYNFTATITIPSETAPKQMFARNTTTTATKTTLKRVSSR